MARVRAKITEEQTRIESVESRKRQAAEKKFAKKG
jgi:hypothetical protein